MNVLIWTTPDVGVQKIADSIEAGAKEVQAAVTRTKTAITKQNVDLAEFVFFGCAFSEFGKPAVQQALASAARKNAALFFIGPKTDSKAVEAAVQKASKAGVNLKGTFFATLEGPLSFLGMGSVKEADLIRARGFGERTLNTAFGLQFGGDSEKSRIKGYLK